MLFMIDSKTLLQSQISLSILKLLSQISLVQRHIITRENLRMNGLIASFVINRCNKCNYCVISQLHPVSCMNILSTISYYTHWVIH